MGKKHASQYANFGSLHAHTTVIKAVAESNQLVLEVKDLQGKPVDTIVIPAK